MKKMCRNVRNNSLITGRFFHKYHQDLVLAGSIIHSMYVGVAASNLATYSSVDEGTSKQI